MQSYATPEIYVLIMTVEGYLAASLEKPVESDEIPW